MLIGAIPIEAELHKRQLSLLYSILVSENTKLRTLMERQLIVNSENPESFFPRVQEILQYYSLMPIHKLEKNLPTKFQWKKQINTAIADKWTSKLQTEIKEKSTLKFCNTTELKIHQTHPVWNSLPSVTYEVKMAQIKARLLTGTYLLECDMQKFKREQEKANCTLCHLEKETLEHFLLKCPALHDKRQKSFPDLKKTHHTVCWI
ncbi:unnamed protein product [Mytilus coruscus]|uniref:Reverse transcriptase zinc-binding domain-containing protein n=1 Tax=Mytilus coruscus TaxID=42192 RepID=A0A6J8C8B4_MYTCO|nr:unnamed protein product [Mytilus coruscus]